MIREVLHMGDSRLRQKAKKVTQFTPGLKKLAEDMLETMRYNDGVGLAAPQLGLLQRIFVAEIPQPEDGDDQEAHPQSGKTYIIINPEILNAASILAEGEEGCLSVPGYRGLVDRPEWVEIKAQNLQGRPVKLKVDGLLARIFFHEIDHLNGQLYVDHIRDREKLWELTAEDEEAEVEAAEAA
jgi:peptide deformylase